MAVYLFLANAPYEIPLYKIINVVLNILEKEGVERISQARGLELVLYHWRIQQSVPLSELNDLLRQVNKFPPLPTSWVKSILILCMSVPDIDLGLLLDFWEKSKCLKSQFRFICKEKLSHGWNQILERLLSCNRASALDFIITILASESPNDQMQNTLLMRLLAESPSYVNDDESFELYYRALLNLDPSLEEFSLWLNPEVIDLVRKSPWMLDRLSNRFGSAVDPKFKLDHQQLRSQLLTFIINRHNYPENTALGALESILKIDEVNLPALNSKTWQQSCEE